MIIEEIKGNRIKYMDIFLIGDPEKKQVMKYLSDSKVFILFDDDKPISAIVILEIDGSTVEIKNFSTVGNKQGQGYGRTLIEYIMKIYKEKDMIIGTGNSSVINLKFYKSLGFREFKVVKNFFIDNYEEDIYENGIQCRDLIYLKKGKDLD